MRQLVELRHSTSRGNWVAVQQDRAGPFADLGSRISSEAVNVRDDKATPAPPQLLVTPNHVSPESLVDVRDRLLMSTVFLYTNEDQPHGKKEHRFAGTASCVRANGHKYLLTAAHVWSALPGAQFAVATEEHHLLVGIEKVLVSVSEAYSGNNDEHGPDLALIKLPPTDSDLLPSTKSWRNLDLDVVSANPTASGGQLHFLAGAPAELSTFGTDLGKDFDVLKGCVFGFGKHVVREANGYDYVDLSFDHADAGPRSYKGVSGGGLWTAQFTKIDGQDTWQWDGTVSLRGVAFFQKNETQEAGFIRCHGRRSVNSLIANSLLEDAQVPEHGTEPGQSGQSNNVA